MSVFSRFALGLVLLAFFFLTGLFVWAQDTPPPAPTPTVTTTSGSTLTDVPLTATPAFTSATLITSLVGELAAGIPSASTTFQASAGTVIAFSVMVSGNASVDIVVLDVNGQGITFFGTGETQSGPIMGTPGLVKISGQQTLSVSRHAGGDANAAVSFSVSVYQLPVQRLQPDETVSGYVALETARAYQIELTAFQTMYVIMEAEMGGAIGPVVQSINESLLPTSEPAPIEQGQSVIRYLPTQSGTFTLMMRQYLSTARTFTMRVLVPDAVPMTLGQPVEVEFDAETPFHSFSIDVNSIDSWNVLAEGLNGEDVWVALRSQTSPLYIQDDDSGDGYAAELLAIPVGSGEQVILDVGLTNVMQSGRARVLVERDNSQVLQPGDTAQLSLRPKRGFASVSFMTEVNVRYCVTARLSRATLSLLEMFIWHGGGVVNQASGSNVPEFVLEFDALEAGEALAIFRQQSADRIALEVTLERLDG